jgi:hypothetical protein
MAWVGMGGHMSCYGRAWVGMGGHRSLLMVMVWVWVQIRRKMLGFAGDRYLGVRDFDKFVDWNGGVRSARKCRG